MAGQYARNAMLRRAASFEDRLGTAVSPTDQVAAASAAIRSLMKTLTPDIAQAWADHFVAFCRTKVDTLTSANTEEIDGGDAARSGRQWVAGQGADPQNRTSTGVAEPAGHVENTSRAGVGLVPAPAVPAGRPEPAAGSGRAGSPAGRHVHACLVRPAGESDHRDEEVANHDCH